MPQATMHNSLQLMSGIWSTVVVSRNTVFVPMGWPPCDPPPFVVCAQLPVGSAQSRCGTAPHAMPAHGDESIERARITGVKCPHTRVNGSTRVSSGPKPSCGRALGRLYFPRGQASLDAWSGRGTDRYLKMSRVKVHCRNNDFSYRVIYLITKHIES